MPSTRCKPLDSRSFRWRSARADLILELVRLLMIFMF
jgi:hypothetical protein